LTMALSTLKDDVLLNIEDLHVHFQAYEGIANVINGVSLKVRRGETVALVGETGCGKSVTSKAVLGLLPGSARIVQGHIQFRGRDLVGVSEADFQENIRGKGISMIFQDPMTSLNPVFTVGQQLENVLLWQGRHFNLLGHGRASLERRKLREARERAVAMLERVRIPTPDKMLDRYPVELSGGMRQRVLIALALISDPELLIADEPGTALDVSIQDQILELLGDLVSQRNTAVLYITHDLGVARNVSDRIYVMYAGEIVEEAPTSLMFREQYHPYSRGLLASIPKLTGEMGAGIGGRIPDYFDPPGGCRFAPRCDYVHEACATRPPMREYEDGRRVACHLVDSELGGVDSGR